MQKITKLLFFQCFFDLLEKISIISLKSTEYKEFELILNYLKKIINTEEFKDEINIIIIVKNNLIQNFINNLLENINTIEMEKNFPKYKDELIKFYIHFIEYRYKISNLFSNFLELSRNSFGHLYNFNYNKNSIIKDISLYDFYSILLYELTKKEKEITKTKNLMKSCFMFDNKQSILLLRFQKLNLDKAILFFSFQIGKEPNILNNAQELPLFIIKSDNKKDLILKIFLKKIEGKDNKQIKYNLCITQSDDNIGNIINVEEDKFIIDNKEIYYVGLYINEKKLKVFIFHDTYKKNESSLVYKELNIHKLNKENFILIIGNDEINSFHNGKIGPIIIIKSKDIKEIENFIIKTLKSKENYKDCLLMDTNLSKFNYNLKDYYEEDLYENYRILTDENKDEKKIKIECLLDLYPDYFNNFDNNIFNEEKKDSNIDYFPIISNLYKENYSLLKLNISIINYEKIIKLFFLDNGLSYINLQLEFYNQFAQYFYLKNNNNHIIYNKEDLKLILNDIIKSFKTIILLLESHIQSMNLIDSYKNIYTSFFNCLLNLNKITPIINDIIDNLLIFKDIYRGIISTSQSPIDGFEFLDGFINVPKSVNLININDINNLKSFIRTITSYYIGIVEILLTTDFYNNSQKNTNISLINKLFNNFLASGIIIDIKEENEDFNNKIYERIFYKLINFIPLLITYFKKKENNENYIFLDEKEEKEKDTYINLLKLNFKLLIKIFFVKNDLKKEEFIHKLFRFVFGNNKLNYYIMYSYLDTLYNYSIDKNIFLFFNENEITYLKKFLYKLNENIHVEKDLKEKLENLLITILYDYIFSNPKKKLINLNFIEEYLKGNDKPKNLLLKIKTIFERYLVNNLFNNNDKNMIINDLNIQEIMTNTWDIFQLLIIILKSIKINKSKFIEKDFNEYLHIIIYEIESQIQEKLNLSIIDDFLIIYLINNIKFLNLISKDDELNFLLNDKFFFKLIDNALINSIKTTLFHSNIYFVLNKNDEKNNIENNKEETKLVSQIFLDIYKIHLEQIYSKYNNDKKNEFSDDDCIFMDSFSKIIENTFIQDIQLSHFNIKKNPNSNYDNKMTIFFLTDFLNLLISDKKYFKKYEKNKNLSSLINFYKETKEILSNIYKNNKEINNNSDFYFTSYYFYEMFELKNKLETYKKNEYIIKLTKLKSKIGDLQSQLLYFEIIILDDHLKINQINKDFYCKKPPNNNFILKNLFKIIQNKIFDKKNKNKKDMVVIFNSLEKEINDFKVKLKEENYIEFDLNELKKSIKKENINQQILDNTPPLEKKLSPNNIQIKDKNKDVKEKTKKDNKDEININEKEDNILSINFTETTKINDLSTINTISDSEKEIEKIVSKANVKEDGKDDNNYIEEIEELPLFELESKSYPKNIFEEIDKNYIINPKKQFMKIIFGTYFEETFFNNETFQKLKFIFLNHFKNTNAETKLLNYPSKLKSFTNGLEPPLFLKENNKFFISRTFPISHKYFYKYMNEYNIKNESIILIKKDISIDPPIDAINNKEEKNIFDCELIKIDKIYFGYIINSVKDGFFIFKEKEFIIDDNASNIKEEYEKKIFSLSALDIVNTINAKNARKNAINIFKDEDIFPYEEFNNKTLIIFYSDIEEIIERRFLYLWQGIEIFLKNGKSYIFNMLTFENYNNLMKHFKNIKNVLYREKDFFSKTELIAQNWKQNKLNTYEYLLFMNKYGSRSLNDPSQYYVFPWVLINFTDLLEINEKEKELCKYIQNNKDREEINTLEINEQVPNNFMAFGESNNNDINNNDNIIEDKENINDKDKNEDNNKISELFKDFRILKYPVSAQNPINRGNKITKYNDYDETFPHHHGTHYSTSSYIYYYNMRLEPFTTLLIELQNFVQENPDRMMQDLKDTVKIINSGNDNRELIPELYSKIDIFININCVYFGTKKNKSIVDDLNKMFKNDIGINYNILSIYAKFIIEHQKLLNSKSISININNWIDNIFGVGQLPTKKRESSFNIFGKTSYEEKTNLHDKLNRLFAKGYDNNKIKKKLANRINLIISFGQTPQKILKVKQSERDREDKKENKQEKIMVEAEDDPENYGFKEEEKEDEDYLGDDFISNFILNHARNDNNIVHIKVKGIFFDINPTIGKIFILDKSSKLSIISSTFYSYIQSSNSFYKFNNNIRIYKLPYICLYDKLKIENNNYYIYNIKYSFSSFPIDINKADTQVFYLYSNQYIREHKNIKDMENKEEIFVNDFKFITCRHLDNSFKIHCGSIDNSKELETYSYFCEDFVMSCKVISSNSFIIGLKNGKLIKALLHENKPNKNSKKKEKNISIDRFKIIIDKHIQGHKGSINMIELDEKRGVIITSGDDNKLYIRKIFDFELLTCIKIKHKFIISLAKISPMNFLYIMCYNKNRKQFIIFGYTLSGLKFAKSSYSYFITNFYFTTIGNIICVKNWKEICILTANNLNQIKMNSKDEDFIKFNKVQKSIRNVKWIQYDDYEKYYNCERKLISFLSNDSEEYYLKTLKVSKISYFK